MRGIYGHISGGLRVLGADQMIQLLARAKSMTRNMAHKARGRTYDAECIRWLQESLASHLKTISLIDVDESGFGVVARYHIEGKHDKRKARWRWGSTGRRGKN